MTPAPRVRPVDGPRGVGVAAVGPIRESLDSLLAGSLCLFRRLADPLQLQHAFVGEAEVIGEKKVEGFPGTALSRQVQENGAEPVRGDPGPLRSRFPGESVDPLPRAPGL